MKKGSAEQNHLSSKQETAVSKLKEKHNSEYEVEHLGSGTHKVSFKDGNQYILNKDGEAGDVSDAAADKYSKESDVAIHEDAAKIAEHAGISKDEFIKLHPGTKKELYNSYIKEVKGELDLLKHPQYTKEDYDYLKGKGWSAKEIKERWDEENKKGDAPQTWGKDNKDNKDSNSFANKVAQDKQRSVAGSSSSRSL